METNKINKEINSPQELAQKDILECIEEHNKHIIRLNFMESYKIYLDDTCRIPIKNRFLLEFGGKILSVNYISKQNILVIKKVTNFKVVNAVTIVHVYNNKSGKKDEIHYNITLETDTCYRKADIEIKECAKSNFNKFQESLNSVDNNFQMQFTATEFKTFVEDFILPKIKNKIIIYENCGVIKPNTFLGENFLIENEKIFKLNELGIIPTSDDKIALRPNTKRYYKLPQLSNSTKKASVVAEDFIKNIEDSWGNNYYLALLIIGHMIMGLFYEKFISGIGTPILIVAGVSGCGKSTIIQNGLSIFGMGEDFLIAGNSTVLGQQSMSQSINGVNVCTDDLSDNVLCSNAFGNNIKSLFKGIPRVKRIDYGRAIAMEHLCSQMIYSTNSALPEIPELENRANLITIMKNSLNTEKYKYLSEHKENTEELSLILPELLKVSEDYVIKVHNELKEYLKENVSNSIIERIPHNIAYMWTGLKLLENIAGYTPNDIHQDIIKYTKESIEHYNKLPTPIDMLLNSLLTLKNHNAIVNNQHYSLKLKDDRVLLMFHKDTLLEAYNRFFKEEHKKIKSNIFNNYLKCDKRVITLRKTGYYGGERKSSIIIDMTDSTDVWEFSEFQEPITEPNLKNTELSEINKIFNY